MGARTHRDVPTSVPLFSNIANSPPSSLPLPPVTPISFSPSILFRFGNSARRCPGIYGRCENCDNSGKVITRSRVHGVDIRPSPLVIFKHRYELDQSFTSGVRERLIHRTMLGDRPTDRSVLPPCARHNFFSLLDQRTHRSQSMNNGTRRHLLNERRRAAPRSRKVQLSFRVTSFICVTFKIIFMKFHELH